MNVLVTGGTGIIGRGLVPALLAAGHTVRLLTRHAEEDAREWPEGVEACPGDVTDPDSLAGVADGCDAVVHITGIVKEAPPEVTYERVNVGGTRSVLAEAERAGVRRFVYVSSLGADRGESGYHASKREAEAIVRQFRGAWLVVRPGNVYGPHDEVISLLLKMARTLPALPVIDDGGQRFQPVWYEDLGRALAQAATRDDLAAQTLEVGGDEVVTLVDLLDRLASLTGRSPARVPVPSLFATLGLRLAEQLSITDMLSRVAGVDIPFNEAELTMLREENFIRDPGANALTTVFGVTPLPLDEGLRRLAGTVPEQLPDEGVGELKRKRFWAIIEGSDLDAAGLLDVFRNEAFELLPLSFVAGPGTAERIEPGASLTLRLPYRGDVQVRVEEATGHHVTFATVGGHPLAGIVRFIAEPHDGDVRFMVEIFARAANLFDWIAMKAAGETMQASTWVQAVERMVARSGGTAPEGVQQDRHAFDDAGAEEVEAWVADLILRRRREENASASAS